MTLPFILSREDVWLLARVRSYHHSFENYREELYITTK